MMVGNVGDRLRVYLFGVPPTATDLLEIQFWKTTMMRKHWGRKVIGSFKINTKIAIAFVGALF